MGYNHYDTNSLNYKISTKEHKNEFWSDICNIYYKDNKPIIWIRKIQIRHGYIYNYNFLSDNILTEKWIFIPYEIM